MTRQGVAVFIATVLIQTHCLILQDYYENLFRQLDVNPTAPTTTPTTTTQSETTELVVSPTDTAATTESSSLGTSTDASNTSTPAPTPLSFLQAGSTLILNPGDVYGIQSWNFNSPTSYAYGGSILRWQFQANQCLLNVTCPCANIPPSYNCLESYLKLRTGVFYDLQKYCGGNVPTNFTSDSGQVNIKYHPSSRTLSYFACYVSCTGFGQNATPLMGINCP